LVHGWFAAQLDITDPNMQLRLLVDSLKPVVAGSSSDRATSSNIMRDDIRGMGNCRRAARPCGWQRNQTKSKKIKGTRWKKSRIGTPECKETVKLDVDRSPASADRTTRADLPPSERSKNTADLLRHLGDISGLWRI
jgi:hypothetical protein